MSISIGDVLKKRDFEEPPEVQVIKDFVQDTFQAGCTVTIQPTMIIISVRGAALAGSLRPHLHQLKASCRTDKRLVIRIG
jgi:hypothetical protein